MLKYVVLALCAALYVEAYPTGAPSSACVNMVPGHHVPPKKGTPPFTITTGSKIVKAGTPLEIVITAHDPKKPMAGILLQVRHEDQPIGTFSLSPNDKFAQLLNCGTPGNAVTHKKHDPQDDQTQVTYLWTPPADFSGEVKCRATIAESFEDFWVGVESAPIKVIN